MFGLENIERTKPVTGKILLSRDQTKELYEKRGFKFKRTVAVIGNQKGGVGKSLLTLNTAIKKAREGARVLIIDLDPESCATNFLLKDDAFDKEFKTMLEIFRDELVFKDAILPTKYDGLDIVPCMGKARRAEKFVRDEPLGTLMARKMEGLEAYDVILFEVPPTFSSIIEAAYIASDIVIMPCFPDAWSIESCMLTNEDIRDSSAKWSTETPEIKIILNKYNEHRKASKDAWSTLVRDFGDQVLPFTIKDTAELQNSINNGNSVFDKGVKASKVLKESISELAGFICPLEDTNEAIH
jgi:chromosome partitioning protein